MKDIDRSAEINSYIFREREIKMKDKLQNVLLSISSKVETNKYLGSIKEAFTMFVPFIIVGSFGSMLNILVSGANGLAQWVPWFIKFISSIYSDKFCDYFLYVITNCIFNWL